MQSPVNCEHLAPSLTASPEIVGVDQLFREYSAYVAAFLRRIGTRADSVDDAVQEVFLVAYRRGGYRPGSASARTWLGAIALRVAANARRSHRRKRETLNAGSIEWISDSATPDTVAALRQELVQVARRLDAMSDAHRDAFLKFSLAGDSCDDIAAAAGVPTGTVYSRLHTVRNSLAQ